jgi:hypothetical protein
MQLDDVPNCNQYRVKEYLIMRNGFLNILSNAKEELFEKGGAEEIFSHVRNLVVATLIMAAGIYAVRNALWTSVPGVVSVEFAGYAVTVLGFLIALLNFFDGLYKLSRKGWHTVLQLAVIVAYLFISLRIAQLLFLFRNP